MQEQDLLQANERIDQLYSQDVQIIQSNEVFSFSLDAVLLANFVPATKKTRLKVVDMCAGNGAVGLFLHSKIPSHFTEVEIQPRLADMAQRSVILNQLEEQYTVLNLDIADLYSKIDKDSVDIVLCNPPYFTDLPDSKKNPNEYLAIARHELKTNLDGVVSVMSGLLKTNGRGYMVHRPDRLTEIFDIFRKYRMAPKRIQFIHSKPGREANMVLIEAIRDGRPGGVRIIEPIVVADQQNEYTPQVKEMLYGK